MLWAISLITLYFTGVQCSEPTLTPTFAPSDQNLVTFLVQLTLKDVQSTLITDYGKDVVVETVRDSLICCQHDFSVIITNYYPGRWVTTRKLGEDAPLNMFLRSRKLPTVPTTVFNISVSFLYTDMKYDSAFEAFNSMTDVLVKNLELGGFETKLDEN